jgi:hypothetical protein
MGVPEIRTKNWNPQPRPRIIPFIIFYGGSCSVVIDGDRDIRRCYIARFVIIHIVLLAVFVFLGGQSEELDQTKAQQRQP